MENCVNFMLAEDALYICWGGDVSLLKDKVASIVEYAGVIEGSTVVQLVK